MVGTVFAELARYLEAHQIAYGMFADKQKPPKDTGSIPIHYVNLSSQAALKQSLDHLQPQPVVTAILTSGYEHYVLPAAWLSEYFKVPGPSPQSARAATDKLLMRRQFKQFCPEFTPDFALVKSWSDAKQFATTHQFPLILKPTNLMKSLLITQSNSLEELEHNLKLTRAQLPGIKDKLYMHDEPRILIEEFMDGSMHTVAGFVDNQGQITLLPEIVDCITAQQHDVNDNYIYCRQLPSSLSHNDQQAILQAATAGVDALQLTNCPLHIEIMLGKQGPRIIEIGARIGGYRAQMYKIGCGINLYRAALDNARGNAVTIASDKKLSMAIVELFSDKSGRFVSIRGLEALQKLASFRAITIKAKPNEQVGASKAGFRAAATISLSNSDHQTFQDDLAYIEQHVGVEVSRRS